MMPIFVDSSGLLALLDADATHHAPALAAWRRLAEARERLFTSNYVLLESSALIQKRFGIGALRDFSDNVVPLLMVEWVDDSLHGEGHRMVLALGRRDLGLVDCTSFLLMRRLGIRAVFALDRHFAEQGFDCLPALDAAPDGTEPPQRLPRGDQV